MNIEKLVEQSIIERLSGIAKAYNEDEIRIVVGSQIATIEFLNDSIDNAMVRMYRKDGTLISRTEYKNYKRHGEGIEFWPDEKIKTSIVFENDKRTYAIEYDKKGNLIAEKNYCRGRLDGKTTRHNILYGTKAETYYKSGKRKQIIEYRKDGTKSKVQRYAGYWGDLIDTRRYNKNGKLTSTKPKGYRMAPLRPW